MQIVIDIDEDTYRYMQSRCQYQNKGDKGLSKFEEVGVAIKNGTPLPKGHGRLIDAGKFVDVLNNAQIEGLNTYKGLGRAKELLTETHTIIEADKEVENEKM